MPDPPGTHPLVVPPSGIQAEHAARVADRQRAGWEPHGAGRRPVMVFAVPSGVQEDPLEMERTAWTQLPCRPDVILTSVSQKDWVGS